MWYFAYGSNLNQADLDRWCDKHPVPRLKLNQKTWQRATLRDFAIVFDCYSTSRGCEAANVRPLAANNVRGVAFKVSQEELEIIAQKENTPRTYVQDDVEVTLEDESKVPAKTFICRPGTERQGGRPSPEYLGLIIEGAIEYGLDQEWINKLKQLPTQTKEG